MQKWRKANTSFAKVIKEPFSLSTKEVQSITRHQALYSELIRLKLIVRSGWIIDQTFSG